MSSPPYESPSDPSHSARLMQTLSMGVYVVGVCDGERCNAFTASSVMSVSLNPVMLAVAVGRHHASHAMICSGSGFVVNVLHAGQLELARHFGTQSGRTVDKLRGIRWRTAANGAPILEDALAFFECEPHARQLAGDHELIVARVYAGDVLQPGTPLSYSETHNMDGAAERYGPIAGSSSAATGR
jgi:flavin reductase (DIM6/NTAB) family NADH-FMN oxidoreductase RutF